jgi:hypothetical protein
VTDRAGDGHHVNTDVTSAWLSESAAGVRAVIQVNEAVWEPAHDDSEAAGFAMLFSVAGELRYVRAEAPRPPEPVRYDYGTWTAAGGFSSQGSTSGETSTGPRGTVTIVIPPAAGAIAGTRLADPHVLTYDGVDSGTPHWVDRAPGGVQPGDGLERGADFIVGSCLSGGPGPPSSTTAVSLSAPARQPGGGPVTVSGRVTPARSGVTVELTSSATGSAAPTLSTDSAGRFSRQVNVSETTSFRAEAEGVASQTVTVTVASITRITVKKEGRGRYRVTGTVRPALPGRVLLLKRNAYRPTAKTNARKGRFVFLLRKPSRGSYQAVFEPSGNRAERSTSNKGVVR